MNINLNILIIPQLEKFKGLRSICRGSVTLKHYNLAVANIKKYMAKRCYLLHAPHRVYIFTVILPLDEVFKICHLLI